MGKIVLYLAMSVDGYIADEQGGVGWLGGDGSEPDAPGSYPAFYETVDTIVMGWTTYRQIVTELSPDSWPLSLIHISEPTRQIWICGGASVAGQLLKEGRIDKLWLSVIPTVLGKGVRLYPELGPELPLKLVGTEHYNGIVDLVYEKR